MFNGRRATSAVGFLLALLVLGGLVSVVREADQPGVRSGEPRGERSAAAEATAALPRGKPASAAVAGGPEVAARSWLGSNPGRTSGLGSGDFRLDAVSRAVGEGQSIVRFRQSVAGLPVIAGEAALLVSRDGKVKAATVEVSSSPMPSGPPRLDRERAAEVAVGDTARRAGITAAGSGLEASRPRLEIYDPSLIGDPRGGMPRLVWRTEVRSVRILDIRRDVFVDALSGKVANSINGIAAALNRKVCDAASQSRDVPCLSPARTEGQPSTGTLDVDKAYEFAGDTWEFFDALGRDSLDGNGMAIVSTVRYCGVDGSGFYQCPFRNAFWNGSQMVYGAGYSRADDVVAHELAHGVTEYSSDLFYYFQSGAINEGLSDVFGEFVDLTNGSGTDTAAVRWKIGEDLPGGAIRDMANPPAFGDPDRTGSTLYDADPDFTDDGGVHANSGVVNRAASLMADGGSFNGQSVTGIGVGKASPIWYQASLLLTSGSDFRDLGEALQQACTSLLGTSGITSTDCAQVTKATVATQLGVTPAKAPVTQAPVCESGTPADTWTESFERGPGTANGWARTASVGANRWYWALERPQDAAYSRDGKQNLWANSDDSRGDTTIAMNTSVAIPAGAFLRFEHSWDLEVTDGLTADGGIIEYSTNSGVSWDDAGSLMSHGGYNGRIYNGADSTNPLAGRNAFVGNSRGYSSTRLDLAPLDGRTVRFRYRLATDSGNGGFTYGGWHIDRMRIYTCGGSAPAVSAFPLAQPMSKGAITPSREGQLAWTVTFGEPVTGLAAADFTVGGTSSGWTVASVSGSGAGPYTVSLSGPAATDGTVTLALKAASVTGASSVIGPSTSVTSANQVRVDRTPPTTSLVTAPGAWLRSTLAGFRFAGTDSGGSGVVGFECTRGSFAAAPSAPRNPADSCTNPKSFSGLAQGGHTVLGRAVDAAGNVDPTPTTTVFTVDTFAPDTRISSMTTPGTRPTFRFSSPADDVASWQCSYDSGSWFRCSSPHRRNTALARGSHVFRVRAIDLAGNPDPTPASKSFRS